MKLGKKDIIKIVEKSLDEGISVLIVNRNIRDDSALMGACKKIPPPIMNRLRFIEVVE